MGIKRFALIVGVCCLALAGRATPSVAQDSGFGLGVVVGDPTGLSGKGWINAQNAIDFAVGFGFFGGDHLILQADYLWHFDLKAWSRATMFLHVGVGPKLALFLEDHHNHRHRGEPHDHYDIWFGARAPVGLTFTFERVPLDCFVELSVGLWIIQHVDFDLDAGVGFRYFFR